MRMLHVSTLALAALATTSAAQLTQAVSATFMPTGVSWPTFTCNLFCNGPTTTVNGNIVVPKFSAGLALSGIDVTLSSVNGGSYAGTLSVPMPGFTGVTGEVLPTITLSLPQSPSLVATSSLVATVNANNQPLIAIFLPTQNSGSAGAVSAAGQPSFVGAGNISLPISASFKQNVYPSNHSITGKYTLGSTNTAVVTYKYQPSDLGGATSGQGGPPTQGATGSLQPNGSLTLQLSNGAASSPAILGLIAGAPTPVPWPVGGTLWPLPNPLLFPAVTNAQGAASLVFAIPPSVPAGSTFTTQFGVLDGSAAGGIALSNALSLTTLP